MVGRAGEIRVIASPAIKEAYLELVFSAGIHADASQPHAAQAPVRFLTSPAALAVIRKNRMVEERSS